MKKIVLLALICLAGCEHFQKPKCWDEDVKQYFLSRTITHTLNSGEKVVYNITKLNGIIETPEDTCLAFATLDDNSIVQFTYKKPHYIKISDADGNISKQKTMADEPGEVFYSFKFVDIEDLPNSLK